MQNDSHIILEDLLARWHHWADRYKAVRSYGAAPACREYRSPPGYQSADEVIDDANEKFKMKAVDFHVDQLSEAHRAAISVYARNCYTGHNVWISPRLPKDPMERARILGEAKVILVGKLLSAGVM